MRTWLNVVTAAGGILLAVGAGLWFAPAGLIVAGIELGAAGLLLDDGKP